MKLTKSKLKQIIKEEIQQAINLDEGGLGDWWRAATGQREREWRPNVPSDKPGFDESHWQSADPQLGGEPVARTEEQRGREEMLAVIEAALKDSGAWRCVEATPATSHLADAALFAEGPAKWMAKAPNECRALAETSSILRTLSKLPPFSRGKVGSS